MDLNWTTIISAIIAAAATIMVAMVNKGIVNLKKTSDMHFQRNEIMQLIVQDEVAALKGNAPVNYKVVCELYDEYKKVGNSYITESVKHYMDWASPDKYKKGENMGCGKGKKK